MPKSEGRMVQDNQTRRGPAMGEHPAEEASALPLAAAAPPVDPAPEPARPRQAPPPLPDGQVRPAGADPRAAPPTLKAEKPAIARPAADASAQAQRRTARRRPAGGQPGDRRPANDDSPSIGGLIYSLQQKPSGKPYRVAGIASGAWAAVWVVFSWLMLAPEIQAGTTFMALMAKGNVFLIAAAIVVPIALFWFLAVLAVRAEELRLRSSTMTEVAVRLAEPDRMAEQSIASLGQAVRRQVSFMNDAVSRALGRAGELEALVHNEVAALERSYEENERKIRALIGELAGERHALLSTSERVTDTLRGLGQEVPALIEKLSQQQVTLAGIIEGAAHNLTALETTIATSTQSLEASVATSTGRLETTLGGNADRLQKVLEDYTTGLGYALDARTEQIGATLTQNTEALHAVLGEYTRALDTTLANRAQSIDGQLVERTRALDEAFSERLRLFDESILRSTMAIDGAISERSQALSLAMESHARILSETMGKQAVELDETLMAGITSVRRTSESITRQSIKAIEGLASQSDLLKNISENLLGQINSVTNRFESQGQSIVRAAATLEQANYKIDSTLQARQVELTRTLDRLSGKADEFGQFVTGYSSSIEGSLSDAETRARALTDELKRSAQSRSAEAVQEIERLKLTADAATQRTLDDLRAKFSSVTTEVSEHLGSLSSRVDESTAEMRQRAARAAHELEQEQARLKQQIDSLPRATQESADAMRRSLQDQLRALEHLSSLTSREAQRRDVAVASSPSPAAPALAPPSHPAADRSRQLSSLTATLAQEMNQRRAGPADAEPASPQARGAQGRDGWSLGDLLARASEEEERGHATAAPAASAPAASTPAAMPIQLDQIARALDPATASAIWARLRSGQRGVMVRSLYSPDGRAAFDDLSRRYAAEPRVRAMIDRYIADFERILAEAEQKDATGRTTLGYVASDTGRVYLFLAHATGRLS
jgi:hypothetical protein